MVSSTARAGQRCRGKGNRAKVVHYVDLCKTNRQRAAMRSCPFNQDRSSATRCATCRIASSARDKRARSETCSTPSRKARSTGRSPGSPTIGTPQWQERGGTEDEKQ